LGVIFIAMSWRSSRRYDWPEASAEVPQSASDLAVFLQARFPKARIISTRADGQIDRSFLLTMSESDEPTLRRLPRIAERASQWRGTVMCECLVHWETEELLLEPWGEYGLACPPFVFFGDKELLEQIKQASRSKWVNQGETVNIPRRPDVLGVENFHAL